MKQILVVDDEPSIVTLLQYNLEQAGYGVDVATDGMTALAKIQETDYFCVLLDLMLPKLDGLEVTKQVRQFGNQVPIIIVTAKGAEFDRVFGLEIGADDYVTKPFSPREILARIKAVTRRQEDVSAVASKDSVRIGDLEVNESSHLVRRAGEALTLTPREFELLQYFIHRQGRVLDRATVLAGVWGYDYAGDTRMVDMHVSHLREKIEPDPKHPQYLHTVRGFGYRFGDA
ncbi:response regulator transcription factor [Furfurilactobacillus siliginis]|uniref:Response regulator n=1 Tax=Furfurilactobacillus siliginis TaxID=348151 RepID=A0A0R2L4J4_9LACO|nr:response regulator transcription factor [Furfurilactobacillus siliginis]KRN96595.1 response regulator [Furfurilactobacillus siliginis]GEK29068.1 DNA-binding response regulator [Furfurilactobacillus siliginis]